MYTRLITEVNDFLRPHYITANSSDIFEETLVKIAGAGKMPSKSHMAGIGDGELMAFRLIDIDQETAQQFHGLLKSVDEASVYEEIENNTFEFITDANAIYDHMLPKFKEAVLKLKAMEPEKFQNYQKQCEEDNAIVEYKMFEEIQTELNGMENADLNEFSKGELNVIFNNLKEMVKLNQEHYSHNCGAHDKLIDACALFIKVTNENESLKNKDVIKNVQMKLKEYIAMTVARERLAQLSSLLRSLLGAELLNEPVVKLEAPSENSASKFGSFMNLFRSSPDSSSPTSSQSSQDLEMEEVTQAPAASPRR